MESTGWFDVGREFTEVWHHQEQIRMAVGAPSLDDPRYLKAVIEIAVRGLPHAYRDVPAADGETLVVDVSGPSGGVYTLTRSGERWTRPCSSWWSRRPSNAASASTASSTNSASPA
jgi:hypothetical protein